MGTPGGIMQNKHKLDNCDSANERTLESVTEAIWRDAEKMENTRRLVEVLHGPGTSVHAKKVSRGLQIALTHLTGKSEKEVQEELNARLDAGPHG